MESGLRHSRVRLILVIDAIIQRPFLVLRKEATAAREIFPRVLPFVIIHAMTGIYIGASPITHAVTQCAAYR